MSRKLVAYLSASGETATVDGTVSEDKIKTLLDMSYGLTAPKVRK